MVVKVISAIVGLLFGSMSFFITWQYAGPFYHHKNKTWPPYPKRQVPFVSFSVVFK
jgi:hypothetical protein